MAASSEFASMWSQFPELGLVSFFGSNFKTFVFCFQARKKRVSGSVLWFKEAACLSAFLDGLKIESTQRVPSTANSFRFSWTCCLRGKTCWKKLLVSGLDLWISCYSKKTALPLAFDFLYQTFFVIDWRLDDNPAFCMKTKHKNLISNSC